jgi:predicted alpha/beta-hydrolase family hydrolase
MVADRAGVKWLVYMDYPLHLPGKLQAPRVVYLESSNIPDITL